MLDTRTPCTELLAILLANGECLRTNEEAREKFRADAYWLTKQLEGYGVTFHVTETALKRNVLPGDQRRVTH